MADRARVVASAARPVVDGVVDQTLEVLRRDHLKHDYPRAERHPQRVLAAEGMEHLHQSPDERPLDGFVVDLLIVGLKPRELGRLGLARAGFEGFEQGECDTPHA